MVATSRTANSEFARRFVADILERLSEEQLRERIDGRIERAAGSCRPSWPPSFSGVRFLETTAAYVGHLCAFGLEHPLTLDERRARSEAIRLLERSYRSGRSVGYYGALLDTVRGGFDALDHVLSTLRGALASEERERYTTWLLETRVPPVDRALDREITKIVLREVLVVPEEALLGLRSDELSGNWRELIREHLRVRDVLSGWVAESDLW